MPSRLSPEGFKPLTDTALFKPVQIGALKLDHRIVQAPLTRMRGTKESEGVWAPGDMSVEYYAQRASKGGFQLTEATNISRLVSLSANLQKGALIDLFVVQRLPRYSRSLHNRSTCWLEACHRGSPCERRINLLPALARRSRDCTCVDRGKSNA